eukprot:6186638-Pleurochrysis_carterae.AAC.1
MGAAWWTLDAMKFMALSTADEKTVAQAIREEPRGLDKCRAQLSTLLRETRELAGGAGATAADTGGAARVCDSVSVSPRTCVRDWV